MVRDNPVVQLYIVLVSDICIIDGGDNDSESRLFVLCWQWCPNIIDGMSITVIVNFDVGCVVRRWWQMMWMVLEVGESGMSAVTDQISDSESGLSDFDDKRFLFPNWVPQNDRWSYHCSVGQRDWYVLVLLLHLLQSLHILCRNGVASYLRQQIWYVVRGCSLDRVGILDIV